ncbi:hypothetical protein MMC31_006430, partial [Peltigera leucophlebia]|nr:hypothetical protein [Peltigera leucophlebia]
MSLINGRLVRLHGFTPAKIMLGYVSEWKLTQGEVQEVMPGNTHGAMQEAIQEKMEEIEIRPEGLSIEKMIDGKGRNSELLWSDQYRKITRDMKGTRRPPDPIPRAKS